MDNVSLTERKHSSLSPLPWHQLNFTQVYAVATSARSKLRKEADRSEYVLRRLVAHANILDLAMEELRGSMAQEELSDDLHEEQALNLLETESETSSRVLLSESESVADLEPDAMDADLTLVRTPSLSSHAAPTSDRTDNDSSAVHIPTSNLIQRLVIASILDDIEKELSDEGSDEDEGPVADGTTSHRSNKTPSSHAGSIFSQTPVLPAVKTTANLLVSKPKPLKQSIPAVA